MNSSVAQGRWQQFKGALEAHWGQVTGDPLSVLVGRHRQRVGKLHAATALAQNDIAREIERIQRRSLGLGRGA